MSEQDETEPYFVLEFCRAGFEDAAAGLLKPDTAASMAAMCSASLEARKPSEGTPSPATPEPSLEHTRSCGHWGPLGDNGCTCGLNHRILAQNNYEQYMAWRKRAEEAEAELDSTRSALREAQEDTRRIELLESRRDEMQIDTRYHDEGIVVLFDREMTPIAKGATVRAAIDAAAGSTT